MCCFCFTVDPTEFLARSALPRVFRSLFYMFYTVYFNLWIHKCVCRLTIYHFSPAPCPWPVHTNELDWTSFIVADVPLSMFISYTYYVPRPLMCVWMRMRAATETETNDGAKINDAITLLTIPGGSPAIRNRINAVRVIFWHFSLIAGLSCGFRVIWKVTNFWIVRNLDKKKQNNCSLTSPECKSFFYYLIPNKVQWIFNKSFETTIKRKKYEQKIDIIKN